MPLAPMPHHQIVIVAPRHPMIGSHLFMSLCAGLVLVCLHGSSPDAQANARSSKAAVLPYVREPIRLKLSTSLTPVGNRGWVSIDHDSVSTPETTHDP